MQVAARRIGVLESLRSGVSWIAVTLSYAGAACGAKTVWIKELGLFGKKEKFCRKKNRAKLENSSVVPAFWVFFLISQYEEWVLKANGFLVFKSLPKASKPWRKVVEKCSILGGLE